MEKMISVVLCFCVEWTYLLVLGGIIGLHVEV